MSLTREEILANDGDPAILDRLDIRNQNGYILAKFGLGYELFVKPRDRMELRKEMLEAERKYYETFKDKLTHLLLPEQRRAPKIKGDPFERFYREHEKTPASNGFSARLFIEHNSPELPSEPPKYLIGFLVSRADENELSYIHANMPVGDSQNGHNFNCLLEHVLHSSKLLKPVHGVAGFSLIFQPGLEQNAKHAYSSMKRHPGLEFIDSLSFSLEVKSQFNRIKGVNWLTVLGNEVLEELGGIESARATLEPDCTLHEYDGGIVIQAGPVPQLGDAYHNLIPQRYRKVALFTQPVRFEDYRSSLFRVFPPLDGPTEAVSWVRRFD
ncbi:MAG: DUF3396 domain-containing protein [Candidatus Thiodiazotropha sp.]